MPREPPVTRAVRPASESQTPEADGFCMPRVSPTRLRRCKRKASTLRRAACAGYTETVSTATAGRPSRREIELDFIRGIAILLVIDFHAHYGIVNSIVRPFGVQPLGWM